MNLKYLKLVFLSVVASLAFTGPAFSKGKRKKYHCEIEKDGKTIDNHKIKSRKKCKKKGGKWVKEHDHDHDHDHDHAH